MTSLAKKAFELFGQPEATAEASMPTSETAHNDARPPVRSARPHLTATGELIIPFDCDPKYHWWKPGGQSLAETLAELNAPPEVWRRYVAGYTATRQ